MILEEIAGDNQQCNQVFQKLRGEVGRGNWQVITSGFALMETVERLRIDACLRRLLKFKKLFGRKELQKIAIGAYDFDQSDIREARKTVRKWLKGYQGYITTEPLKAPSSFTSQFDFSSTPYLFICSSPIQFADCIHLSAAILLGADLLLTQDSDFRRIVRKALQDSDDPLHIELEAILSKVTGRRPPISLERQLKIVNYQDLLAT